jgi:hypothetical protein
MENNSIPSRNLNSPSKLLSKEELKILKEPDIYRKLGERVEDALYRDYIKRTAR